MLKNFSKKLFTPHLLSRVINFTSKLNFIKQTVNMWNILRGAGLILIIAFQAIGFLFFLSAPTQAADMPKFKNPLTDLQVKIPGLEKLAAEHPAKCDEVNGETKCQIPWIGVYISSLYKYAIGIVGILAAVILMVGGIIWLTAGGNQTRVGEAKAWIGASLTGLIIALTSYMILYQVNPALTQFRPVEMKIVTGTPTATGTPSGFVDGSSPDLANFISCMEGKNIPNFIITSTTDNNIAKKLCDPTDPNEKFEDPLNCVHTKYSCHYGGRTCANKGSYAIDIDDAANPQTVAKRAMECGEEIDKKRPVAEQSDYPKYIARCNLNEKGTHHHLSIGAGICDCDNSMSPCINQQ